MRSLDGLASDFRYLAKALDKEEQGKQFDGFFKTAIDGKGIDTKRPWGFYAQVHDDIESSSAVALLPVSDNKAFLKLLEKFNVEAEKDDDGIYKLEVPKSPVPVFLRFTKKYAYLAVKNKSALDDKELLDPERVLAGDAGLMTVSLHIDQVPEKFRDQIIEATKAAAAREADKKDEDETEYHRQGRIIGATFAAKQIAAIMNDGGSLSLRLDVNQKNQRRLDGVDPQGQGRLGSRHLDRRSRQAEKPLRRSRRIGHRDQHARAFLLARRTAETAGRRRRQGHQGSRRECGRGRHPEENRR